MQEVGGAESLSPDEGSGGTEQASEQAREQYAAAQAAQQQARRDEQKAKKRDDGVVHAIMQFLTDDQRQHLSVLIARLVSLDCPSSFILSILSLINDECLAAVQEMLKDSLQTTAEDTVNAYASLVPSGQLDAQSNRALVDWITRMEMVLALDAGGVFTSLRTPEGDIDGTVLQLTTFVLQEFFRVSGKDVPFEKIHPLAAGILQSIFEQYFAEPGALPEAQA